MGRAPCCDKANVKRGPWSPEEDAKLKAYIQQFGTGGNWIALPQKIGLRRCGKSCRLRWLNYLRPNIKHGGFSDEEDTIICTLYMSIGSRWSIIAAQLPGRTDNDIKNYWNTKLKKKLLGKQRKDQRAARSASSSTRLKKQVLNRRRSSKESFMSSTSTTAEALHDHHHVPHDSHDDDDQLHQSFPAAVTRHPYQQVHDRVEDQTVANNINEGILFADDHQQANVHSFNINHMNGLYNYSSSHDQYVSFADGQAISESTSPISSSYYDPIYHGLATDDNNIINPYYSCSALPFHELHEMEYNNIANNFHHDHQLDTLQSFSARDAANRSTTITASTSPESTTSWELDTTNSHAFNSPYLYDAELRNLPTTYSAKLLHT